MRSFLKFWLKHPVLLSLFLLLAGLLCYALLEHLTGRQALEAAKAEMVRRQLPSTPWDLQRSPKAKKQAQELHQALAPFENQPDREARRYFSLLDPMRRSKPGFAIPMSVSQRGVAGEELPWTWEELEDAIVAYQPAMQAVTSKLPNTSILPPGSSLDTLREVAHFLRADGLLQVHLKHHDAWIARVASLTQLSTIGTVSDSMINLTLSLGIYAFTIPSLVWEGLQTDNLSDAQLATLQNILSNHDFLPLFAQALQMQGIGFEEQMRAIRQSPVGVFSNPSPLDQVWLDQTYTSIWLLLWSDHDQAAIIEDWLLALDEVREFQKKREWFSSSLRVRYHERTIQEQSWRLPLREMISIRLLTHSLARSLIRIEMMKQLMILACALERYQLHHGAYPTSLSELAPQFLDPIPHDLFTGNPLHYQRTDKRYQLYSVGPDGVAEPSDKKGDDIHWPQAATDLD